MTLQLYVFRQVAVAFVFAVVGMLIIAVPGMAVSAIQRLGGAFMGPVLGYLPLELLDLFQYVIPIGFLLAVVSTYGRMAAENEWTALCAAGISPLKMLVPSIVMALGLGALSWWLATDVDPVIGMIKREYRRSAAVNGIKVLTPGRTQFRFGKFFLSAKFREGKEEFREAIVNIPGDDEHSEQTLLADRLRITMDQNDLVVSAQGARTIQGNRDARVDHTWAKRSLDSLFGTSKVDRGNWKFQDSPRLAEMLAQGEVPKKDVPEALYVYHHRNARFATFLMFLFLGAPTGIMMRRGTQLGALAVCVGYALAYYLLTLRMGRALAEQGPTLALLGAWSSTIVGGLAGAILTWRLARD